MFNNLYDYNKTIYLILLNNTIRDFKKHILIPEYETILLSNSQEDYKKFYNSSNKKYINLIKDYNYFFNLIFFNSLSSSHSSSNRFHIIHNTI